MFNFESAPFVEASQKFSNFLNQSLLASTPKQLNLCRHQHSKNASRQAYHEGTWVADSSDNLFDKMGRILYKAIRLLVLPKAPIVKKR